MLLVARSKSVVRCVYRYHHHTPLCLLNLIKWGLLLCHHEKLDFVFQGCSLFQLSVWLHFQQHEAEPSPPLHPAVTRV